MAIFQEKQLTTTSRYNRQVEGWAKKVRGLSLTILERTHSTGRLRAELTARLLRDQYAPSGAYVGLGFRFHKYGSYLEYGAGRGYIVKDGIIMKGHSAWRDKKKRKELRAKRMSEYRIRRMRTIDEHYAIIKRSPLPWLDPPIVRNIDELGDIAGNFWGDEALRIVLKNFDIITIEKRYGKK